MYFIVLLGHNQILTLKTLSYANHMAISGNVKKLENTGSSWYNQFAFEKK